MEQRNLTVKDTVPYIGQPSRVYEVLSYKRPLTMTMVWKLHTGLEIPAESGMENPALRGVCLFILKFPPLRRRRIVV
jgi:HTH-type transcriptional regulator/antitoxin HigA